eukprot:TRINITY_DN2698_c0_g1_i1.p1 TRINITY_DN2698_c0_g1~~TRINITY_DN2698_c0_g1_i1.p1  ORF type:complete len:281 (-),score=49.52 TRINITY_DN2698_c0_g1_i1:374-1216(-)
MFLFVVVVILCCCFILYSIRHTLRRLLDGHIFSVKKRNNSVELPRLEKREDTLSVVVDGPDQQSCSDQESPSSSSSSSAPLCSFSTSSFTTASLSASLSRTRIKHTPALINPAAYDVIMSKTIAEQIFEILPEAQSIQDLKLLYHMSADGASISNFYNRAQEQGPTIMLIRDSANYVFGCYASESWRRSSLYFGNGLTFVMSISPTFKAYKWTEKNTYFLLGRDEFIACGGGDHFSLWLDANFRNGSSLHCSTFDSPSLSSTPEFKCYHVEVWGFVTSIF